ncbi:CynX/NimT family MFS transporter [Thauera chlorobenzoica]|uniref:Putative MFS permease n=1 Tax=Thauera chlorobenzoica TaxID=96773 RepID=A0A1H5XDR9_9RHOO|nr:MFS transporter [Thauera chlorobenzoica]APR05519.1 putative MFS permease [Thauera chlorobenzoica]SEG09908.1 Cyanate permease [Thauera chlorobenzoica]
MKATQVFPKGAPALVVILVGIGAALHVGKLPPAIPVLREALGVTLLQAGFLLSLVQFAGMALGLLAGIAVEGLGLRRSMLIGLSVLAFASAAGGLAQDAPMLLGLRAVEGFGFLLTVLPAPALLRALVPPQRLALYLGMWGGYMGIGTALALFCAPWVMAAVGWQGWWWLLAASSLGMALWLWRSVPSDRSRRAAVPAEPAAAAAAATDDWRQRLRLTLGSSGPWLVALCFAMYSSQWLGVVGFLPSIYDQAGLDSGLGGALTALVCLVNVVGNVAAGRLLHHGIQARQILHGAFIAMALGTVVAFGSAFDGLFAVRYVAVLLFSAIGGLIPGALFSLAVQVAPSERTVSATVGWMQQWSSTGQFLGPPLIAWVAALSGGWHWTWAVTGAASLSGLVLASLIARRIRKPQDAAGRAERILPTPPRP